MSRRLAPLSPILTAVVACAAPDAPARGSDAGPFGRAVHALRTATVGTRDSTFGRRTNGTPRRVSRVPAVAAAPAAPAAEPWDTTEFPSRVIPFTSVDAPPDTVWMGDTLTLAPPPVPHGTPSAIARALRWTSAEPNVATVSLDGVVTPRAPGVAQIVAWRRVGQSVTPVTVLPAVGGRVVAVDGAPLRVRVTVRAGDWTDSAWTGPDGAFTLRPRRAPEEAVTVHFEPRGTDHAPALLAGAPIARLHDLDVVLLPARWRIAAGSYAGTPVDIDPRVAYAAARDARHLWRVAGAGRAGAPHGGPAVGWSAARLPLPLAFDRRDGRAVIGAADSAALWAIVRQLERDWGAALFRPATLSPGDDGVPSDAGGVLVTVDPRIRTAGLTTTGWNGDGDLYDAVVAVRSRPMLGDASIVTHELLHALGVGHAPSALASVMHPVAAAAGRATAADVAYGQLLYALRARTRPGRTVVGVAEAAAAVGR